jgi:hypothetical protein
MRTRLVVAAIAVAIVSTSCSTSKATKPSTATSTTAPAAPTTTEPATTSTFGPMVIVTPPPTTTTPKQALEAEIRTAALRLSDLLWACTRMPSECDPASFTTEPYLSTYRTYLADSFLALGRIREMNVGDPTYAVIGSIVPADDGQSAEYDICYWNTEVLVQALPDTERVVLDDFKTSIRQHLWVQLTDSGWLLRSGEDSSPSVVGRNDCGPRS